MRHIRSVALLLVMIMNYNIQHDSSIYVTSQSDTMLNKITNYNLVFFGDQPRLYGLKFRRFGDNISSESVLDRGSG
jgi:hypothetical protein